MKSFLASIKKLRLAGLIIVMISVVAGGCASSMPPPTTELTEARSALKQAEDVNALEHAPLELRAAQNKLDAARTASAKGDQEEARRLAEQATVDAELAAIKARSAKTKKAVQELQESIRALEAEIARNQN